MHVTPSTFFRRILRSKALVYKSYFFRTAALRKLFDIRFSYNHCNFSRVCLLVKMASKTVTRSITITVLTFLVKKSTMINSGVSIFGQYVKKLKSNLILVVVLPLESKGLC